MVSPRPSRPRCAPKNALRSAAELREIFAKAGVKPGDTVVAYCHIGQQATGIVFAARHYLMRLPVPPPCRFDVVGVEAGRIEWLRAAFDAG